MRRNLVLPGRDNGPFCTNNQTQLAPGTSRAVTATTTLYSTNVGNLGGCCIRHVGHNAPTVTGRDAIRRPTSLISTDTLT